MTDPLAADRLARLPGPTPFLLLDLDRVATAYLGFAAELPGVDVHYAMKCNPDAGALRRLHGLGGRFEIASAAELRRCSPSSASTRPTCCTATRSSRPAHIAAA